MQASSNTTSPGSGAVPHAHGPCPIGRASSLLGDRWILLILREATLGVSRFDDFRTRLGIADNILSARLRLLVEHEVLVKVPYHDGRRERSAYRLTPAGADLTPLLLALAHWGEQHTYPDEPQEPMRVIHLDCGGEVRPDQRCAACAGVVGRESQGWIRPWRSAEATQPAQPVLTGRDA